MPNYTSTITLSQMAFHEHFDQEVAILIRDNSPIIDNAIHMCMSADAMLKQIDLEKVNNAEVKLEGMSTVVGIVLDNAIRNEQAEALIMYGFDAPMPLVITRKDLEPLHDVVDSFCAMYAYAHGKIGLDKIYEVLKEKQAYFLGEPFSTDNKNFSVTTIPRTKENGEKYESIVMFLTKENAMRYNPDRRPVSVAPIGLMCDFWKDTYAIVLEPHRNYWVEFNAE